VSTRARLLSVAIIAALPRRLRELELFGINRRARLIRVALVATVVLGAAVLAMPVRLWMGQQRDINQASAQLAELEASNQRLEKRVEELSSPRAVERQARDDFGWAFEGEETYTVPPAPAPYVDLPDVWPFDQLSDSLASAAARQ
jgi:cell division protein FtsB